MGHSNKRRRKYISKHKFVRMCAVHMCAIVRMYTQCGSHVRSIAEKYSYRSSENHEKLQRFRFTLNEKCIKLELLAQ